MVRALQRCGGCPNRLCLVRFYPNILGLPVLTDIAERGFPKKVKGK
jgi:hypothetical protein